MIDLTTITKIESLVHTKDKIENLKFYDEELLSNESQNELNFLIEKLLHQIENDFSASIIELSIFDPDDITGQHFHSLLVCPEGNKEYLDHYQREMTSNIDDQNQILPNIEFYKKPYYSYNPSNERYGNVITKEFYFNIGSFNAISIKRDINSNNGKLITNFFDNIHINCFDDDSSKADTSIDTYVSIPLFRPVSQYRGLKEEIFNGGALFLVGRFKSNEPIQEFILKLRHFLIKSIFNISYSRKEIQAIKDNKSILELETLHSLKNQINHEIVGKLNQVKNFNDNESQKLIKEVLLFSKNIVNKYAELVRDFEEEPYQFDSDSLTFFIAEIASTLGLSTKDIIIKVCRNLDLEINKSVLGSILTQLLENARDNQRDLFNVDQIKYEKYQYSNNIDVSVIEEIIQDAKWYSFTVFNRDTRFPSDILENAGLVTVTETRAGATGVGLKIVNNFLMRLYAFPFSNSQFFEPKNLDNPKGVRVTFKLYHKC